MFSPPLSENSAYATGFDTPSKRILLDGNLDTYSSYTYKGRVMILCSNACVLYWQVVFCIYFVQIFITEFPK